MIITIVSSLQRPIYSITIIACVYPIHVKHCCGIFQSYLLITSCIRSEDYKIVPVSVCLSIYLSGFYDSPCHDRTSKSLHIEKGFHSSIYHPIRWSCDEMLAIHWLRAKTDSMVSPCNKPEGDTRFCVCNRGWHRILCQPLVWILCKNRMIKSSHPLFEGGTAEVALDRFCVPLAQKPSQATSASATLKQGM